MKTNTTQQSVVSLRATDGQELIVNPQQITEKQMKDNTKWQEMHKKEVSKQINQYLYHLQLAFIDSEME